MSKLKRDSKGRFLKRGRSAKANATRKRVRRNACANPSRRTTPRRDPKTGQFLKRARVARANKKRRNARAALRRNLETRETRSGYYGGEIILNKEETAVLRGKNKRASEEQRAAAVAAAKVLARKTGNLVEIKDARGRFITSVSAPF